jgi:hypothetical protein
MKVILPTIFAFGLTLTQHSAAAPWDFDLLAPAKSSALQQVRAVGGSTQVRWSSDQLKAIGLSQTNAPLRAEDVLENAEIQLNTRSGEFGAIVSANLPRIELNFRYANTPIQRQLRGVLFEQSDMLMTEWRDSDGKLWLQGGHSHAELKLKATPPRLEIRYMDLRLGPAFAQAIARPALINHYLGVANISMPVVAQPETLAPSACDVPNWPGPGNKADVALTSIGNFEQMRCENCDGPDPQDGFVVIAPTATLRNVGTVDVPWYEKFTPDSPPYNNDQHPFLVWGMYRQDADGVLRQIGKSGVKHAFFTVNLGCDCRNGSILGVGCKDAYGGATNDTPGDVICSNGENCFQGMRSELIPNSGQFGRCGSVFDPNCNGLQDDVEPYGPYENRMVVNEAELSAPVGSGVRWFADGWYVVRDDGNWINNIGSREVQPNWVNTLGSGIWRFTEQLLDHRDGTVLHRWHALLPSGTKARLSVISTPKGMIVLEVRATQLAANQWRYQNTVFNMDFSVSATLGSGSNIRVLDNRGLDSISFLPSQATALPVSVRTVDADLLATNNWNAAAQANGLRYSGSGNTQDWGSLYSYIYDSPLPPGEITLAFAGVDGVSYRGVIMGPSTDRMFSDGLE